MKDRPPTGRVGPQWLAPTWAPISEASRIRFTAGIPLAGALRPLLSGLSLAGWLTASSACDVVQGFQDASQAVFPPERTYFDAPGYQLLAGNYRTLDFAAGTGLHVLMRSADPADTALYSIKYADPKPCPIPNVKDGYRGAQGVLKGPTMIAYHERDEAESVLRFADGDCHRYDLAIAGADLPVQETEQGFIVVAHDTLLLVNPIDSSVAPISSEIEHVTIGALPRRLNVARGAGRLALFRADWKEIGRFGQDIRSEGALGSSYYFEDSSGVHRLRVHGTEEEPAVTHELIAPGACGLRIPPGLGAAEAWVTYRAGCQQDALTAYSDNSGEASLLHLRSEVEQVALIPDWPNGEGNPETDRFYLFCIVDMDPETHLGQLIMRTPDLAQHFLGERASYDHLVVLRSDSMIHGYALVDVDDSSGLKVGRYIHWQSDGSTQTLAGSVLYGGGDIIASPTGLVGDFALPSMNGLQIVAKQAPYRHLRFSDHSNRWTAIFSDSVDGRTATLSITTNDLDFWTAAQDLGPMPVTQITPIAHGVVADSRAQFVQSLPGIAYLTKYDAAHATGRLDYRNLELGFTATVSDGVSDFVGSLDSLIYSVPFGNSAGIWAVRAR